MEQEGITTKQGAAAGKTVAIFGGMHGNERVGVEVIRRLSQTLTPDAGIVHLVEANPPAIADNVRMQSKNLNRLFVPGLTENEYEVERARNLMALLDGCDALLDIHASNSPESTPFIICEKEGFELAKELNFEIVSSGWDAIEPGAADGYMSQKQKLSLCLECGYAEDYSSNVDAAYAAALQFLAYTGNIVTAASSKRSAPQKMFEVYRTVYKKTDSFVFSRPFGDFDLLKEGEVFATDGEESYIAGPRECIVFPHKEAPIGAEVFILGRYLS